MGALGPIGGGAAGGFGWIDWGVVLVILIGTTIVGERLAGKQSTTRDFFLGGRKLPWYAVSASIVATEISAVTYVSLPSVVFKDGGDMTYLQIGLIGYLLARMIVGYVLVPAYYQREIYSPYDYVGHRLGQPARKMATALFTLGGVLGQSARVYVTAVALEVILHDELSWLEGRLGIDPLVAAIGAIGLVAVLWTLIGGIATVIWTDGILFLLFAVGSLVALLVAAGHVDSGLAGVVGEGWAQGKFRLLDFDTDPTKAYTFWAALIAATWGGVGSFGTDQLMVQRVFCCRSAADARKAVLASIVVMAIVFLVALVGVGLLAYYARNPMQGETLALYAERPDRVFPLFIAQVIPTGLKGLVIAGVLAAAISSLDSIMAALSQTTLSALYMPWRGRALARAGRSTDPDREARHLVRVSRILVVLWAVLLCATAVSMQVAAERYPSILDLALAMAGFTGGALLAGFLLAFLPRPPGGSGFLWSGPLSVATVFAIVFHGPAARDLCIAFAAILLAAWLLLRLRADWGDRRARGLGAVQTAALAAALVGILWIVQEGTFEGGAVLAWPWYIPAGCSVAFLFGILLARRSGEEGGA